LFSCCSYVYVLVVIGEREAIDSNRRVARGV